MTLTDNLTGLGQRIQLAEHQAGRAPGCVQLLAVSKHRPIHQLIEATEAGLQHFGENRIQEACPKIEALKHKHCTWHFIGQVQSNKTRDIAEHFSWLHSLSSAHHALRLSRQRPAHLAPLQVCLQVNVDADMNKSGLTLAAVPALAKQVSSLPGLTLRGLMLLPSQRSTDTQSSIPFASLAHTLAKLNADGYNLDTLSMGMSHDWPLAVAHGATWIRLGRALFGENA